MTTVEQETLPVTQADRDFAADYNLMLSRVTQRDADAIRAGEWDDTREVQQVARHRADHEPRAVEVGLREALEASLGKRSQPTTDPPYTAAFNAALDMVANNVAPFLAAQSPAPTEGEGVRPFAEWREDHGDVLWWRPPTHESPCVGSPLDLGRSMKVVVQIGFEEHDLPITMTGGWPRS